MTDAKSDPSIDSIQRAQIDDWLRQADKNIAAGRYSAADELLQKVFAIDPDNERAESYQDRIHYLITQLSHRVGLSSSVQLELRKYNDAFAKRKTNLVNSYLVKAKKFLEEGNPKKASAYVKRALSHDPLSSYAKLLALRAEELEHERSESGIKTESEQQFKSVLEETWTTGVPSAQQQEILKNLQSQLHVSEERRRDLERDVINHHYRKALHDVWLVGGLAAFSLKMIDELRKKFDVSLINHSTIEALFLREMRKNKVKGTVLIVAHDENELLELAQMLRKNSYAVIAAVSVQEAVEAIRTVRSDVILSEIAIGSGTDGFDLFECIRSSPQTSTIPFIFISSELDRTTHLIGKRLGVDEFLLKPLDEELLCAILDGKMFRQGDGRPSK